MHALKIAATGMAAQQMRVATISNNLANMSTTGYNARRAEFADLHYQQLARAGTINAADGTVLPTGVQLGLGVRPSAISVISPRGRSVRPTGGDLDLAIEGRRLSRGDAALGQVGLYPRRRAQALGRGADREFRGFAVAPEITIPEDARSISINAEGEVFAFFQNEPEAQAIGQLNLAGFSNPKGLEAIGSNLFLETEASGRPT